MNSVLNRRMAAAEREYELALQKTIELLADFTVEGYTVGKNVSGLNYRGRIAYQGKSVGYFEKSDMFNPHHVSFSNMDARTRWDSIKDQMGQINGEMMIDALLSKEGY